MTKNPLFTRVAVVTIVAFVVTVLGHFGIVVPADVKDGVVEVAAVVGPGLVYWWAKRHAKPAPAPQPEQPETPAES